MLFGENINKILFSDTFLTFKSLLVLEILEKNAFALKILYDQVYRRKNIFFGYYSLFKPLKPFKFYKCLRFK